MKHLELMHHQEQVQVSLQRSLNFAACIGIPSISIANNKSIVSSASPAEESVSCRQ